MSDNSYSAKDIVVLSGPLGVRKRPAMYIGSTGSAGYLHLLYEVLDNAVDEFLAGYCKNIRITLAREDDMDVAEVTDDGRGIPTDIMPKENRPALEVIMTSLHAGAKFNSGAYKVSGGLHGVGLTVVNALSEYVDVTVNRDGKTFRQRFGRGVPATQLQEIGSSDGANGTTIRFKPDSEIFQMHRFDTIALTERLHDLSFLCPGLHIYLTDSREGQGSAIEYASKNGLVDFLEFIKNGRTALTKPVIISKSVDFISVDVALQYIDSYSEEVLSFVNKIKTPEGGTHIAGFRAALTRAITNYVQKGAKKDLPAIEGEDTREGLVAIVSVLMQNPEFEGQTKEKLGNTTIKTVLESALYTQLSYYLDEHPGEAEKMLAKVAKSAEAREAARRARELARKKSVFDSAVLPGKLADCIETDPEKAEIFIVEGNSAGGSSKQGRDRIYQAILPLRGKVLNVEKASVEKIFGNSELHTMVTAFGTGIKEGFNAQNLRYGKIILLADADVDGSHIKTLLLTFFYRYLRPLIEQGHVYIAQPPLYRIANGKDVKYAYSDAELNRIMHDAGDRAEVQRYKGLGEMNPEQLWSTTMDPSKRVLKKVAIKDVELANTMFTILMGVDVEKRRKFLEEHSTEVAFLDV
jgi:DNA gyrase subunit B